MNLQLQRATGDDVADLMSLQAAVNKRLGERFGDGHSNRATSEKGTLFRMRQSSVYIVRRRGRVIASLSLQGKKPWAIDTKYFAACKKPLYLLGMAVHPDLQGQGVGRLCIAEARKIALAWPADAIRLDAYDAPAGAGEFYRKAGFTEVGRASYRGVPLIYFEMMLG